VNVSAIILAAGNSSRLGTPKQLILRNGQSLLRRAAETACASRASEVAIVLGFDASRMREELHGLPIRIVENPRWQSGVSTSIIAALEALPANCQGAMFMVCDQPGLNTAHLDSLISAFSHTGRSAVASGYANTIGVPALFDRTLLPELLQLTGDRGAKEVLMRHAGELFIVSWPGGALDIDSEADLSLLL